MESAATPPDLGASPFFLECFGERCWVHPPEWSTNALFTPFTSGGNRAFVEIRDFSLGPAEGLLGAASPYIREVSKASAPAAASREETPAEQGLSLQDPLTVLPGVGPKRAALFTSSFGVTKVSGLLGLLPRKYEEPPVLTTLDQLGEFAGRRVRVLAVVARQQFWRRGRRSTLRLGLTLPADQGDTTQVLAEALFFNQPYRRSAFSDEAPILLEAQVRIDPDKPKALPQLLVPKSLPADAPPPSPGPIPVYPEGEGLSSGVVARAVEAALVLLPKIQDPLPDWLRAKVEVPTLSAALQALHAPPDQEQLQAGRRRLAWGEVLRRELHHQEALQSQGSEAPPIPTDQELWQRIAARLPFALSAEQEEVLAELRADLESGRPMARLLHGEVGSGKTAVAFALALAVVAAGGQVALLAPTEILARQHLDTFRTWLRDSAVEVVAFLGDDSPAARRAALATLGAGRPAIAIGTHALFQPKVHFRNLRLVLFDEQHRFGVRQKAALLAKGEDPHVLTMTATPIPRTLAWAHYGAVQSCTLRSRAGTTATIHTDVAERNQWREVAKAWRPALEAGERAFVVVPHVDGDDGLQAWQDRLLQGPWKGLSSAFVHGRLPGQETARAVGRFRREEVTLLFGTTVVEVGLDVPQVPRMLILGAERFGLASLHQLRGRLSRGAGAANGHCQILAKGEEAVTRLKFLEQAADGFAVAEEDLRRRGPGTLRGRAQHGHSRFQMFDPVADADLILHLADQDIRNWIQDQG
jgi:ATP-dependent DNA helicase RecG